MKTFEKISKSELGKELQWHLEQDKIIQGSYGPEEEAEEFKGCMMGCAVNSISRAKGIHLNHQDHKQQADFLGLPEWFVYLYEGIFEGLDTEDAKQWVIDCFNAIPEGVETTKIDALEIPIKIRILEKTLTYHDNQEVKQVTHQVIEALKGDGDLGEAESAAWSARSAASSARSAAWSTERAARSAFYVELKDYTLELLRGVK
jgi:hypothetical protein